MNESLNPFDMELPESLEDVFEIYEGNFDPNCVKFLVYGESGAGKTTFAATWPNPAFLDIDSGLTSVRRRTGRFKINSWDKLNRSCDFLASGKHNFQTIVLDSINELQYLSMRTIVNEYPAIHRAYRNLPSQSDYGKMLDDVEKVLRFLKSIPLNIVYITQVAERKYDTDPAQPQLVGKASARNLCRMMDIVGFLEKKETEVGSTGAKLRVMTFDAMNFVTKDRSGELPTLVENPRYELLRSYWDLAQPIE
jgi:hypothetical protein